MGIFLKMGGLIKFMDNYLYVTYFHYETQWKGVRHYTRARLENRNGAPVQDSMRKYGTGYTSAKSPYGSSVLSAKTYWGK